MQHCTWLLPALFKWTCYTAASHAHLDPLQALMLLITCLVYKLADLNVQHRTPRRKRNAILFFTEAAFQWANLVFYILPNALLLARPCKWGNPSIFWFGWARWTCWNTVSPCYRCMHPQLGMVISCNRYRRRGCMFEPM